VIETQILLIPGSGACGNFEVGAIRMYGFGPCRVPGAGQPSSWAISGGAAGAHCPAVAPGSSADPGHPDRLACDHY